MPLLSPVLLCGALICLPYIVLALPTWTQLPWLPRSYLAHRTLACAVPSNALMLVFVCCAGGVSASHLDVTPCHAGVIFGFGNTAGTLAGLISVPAMGYMLQRTGSWPLVFGVAAAHNVLGAILWADWVGDTPLPEDGGAMADGKLEADTPGVDTAMEKWSSSHHVHAKYA